MDIGIVLKEKRTGMKLTQGQLAEKIFVSTKTISNWETGKTTPDLDSLIRLANLFDLSLDNLLLEGNHVAENIIQKEKMYDIQRWGLVIPYISSLLLAIYVTLNSLYPNIFDMFYGKYIMLFVIFINFIIDYYMTTELKKNNEIDYKSKIIIIAKFILFALYTIITFTPMVIDIIAFYNRR